MKDFVLGVLTYLGSFGYAGIMLGLMVEVIPSEIVLSYGGFMVSQGTITFAGAVVAGAIGGTIAQLFLYWIGYFGGRPFLEKYGKYLFIRKHHIDLAQRWFEKYGTVVIFTARFVPVVRHAISIPAGISKMSFMKFTIYTLLATIPWSILFIYLGTQLGKNWDKINEAAAPYSNIIVIVAVAILLGYLCISYLKKRRQGA
ncbi:DedA family protein [Brevibacillus ginsengisoli]|uniref:DedA family protein n=1 Tax=Brevibacillus ginsengisoli TaxID=363854 RepID=UPI003CEFA6D9